jgi:hypothetical protein
MPRIVTVAAAQLGPIQKTDTRQAVVARMLGLMDAAKAKGADLVVYPELALTTFFPRWYCEDRREADFWFEKEMPNPATRPLFERATPRSWSTATAPSSASIARCTCRATPSSTGSAATSIWRSATSSPATSASRYGA